MRKCEAPKADPVAAFNRSTYGRVIRAQRLRQGLTQPQLAERLQVHKNYVSNWEMGRARPDLNLIPALCRALQMPIAALFGVQEQESPLTEPQRQHLQRYGLLNERDRSSVDALTEHLLALEDAELRRRCREDFLTLFHNDSVAAAGLLNPLGDGSDGEWVTLRRDPLCEQADEIITVTGDSMEPTFRDGDDLLVQHTDTLEPGEIGILIINGEGFVKEYRANGVYSHNETAYPFRRFRPGDSVKIAGRVLGRVTRRMRPTREEAAMLEELRRDVPERIEG